MQKQLVFKENRFSPIFVNGIFYFDPYEVGKCLGLSESAVRMAVSKMNKSQAVKLTNSTVKDIDSYVKSPFGKLFLTESGMYKLAFRSNKPSAEEFTNWVTDDVLPSIRKTGSYSMKSEPSTQMTFDDYEYYDKTYMGEPVLSLADFSQLSGVTKDTVYGYLMKNGRRNIDYYFLEREALAAFKNENPRFPRPSIRWYIVITKPGFDKLCRLCGVKVEKPQCFKLELAMKKEPVKAYSPSDSMKSLMSYIDRETVLINEYRQRLLQPSTMDEAEMNRRNLVTAIKALRNYSLDTSTILLK